MGGVLKTEGLTSRHVTIGSRPERLSASGDKVVQDITEWAK